MYNGGSPVLRVGLGQDFHKVLHFDLLVSRVLLRNGSVSSPALLLYAVPYLHLLLVFSSSGEDSRMPVVRESRCQDYGLVGGRTRRLKKERAFI